jgi:ubiquinone biosynthesis protein Coq4
MALAIVRRLQALRCFVVLARDPRRLDVVFSLRESLDDPAAMAPILSRLRAMPGPAAALRARPRLTLDLPTLRRLPEGTVGRAYARFMDDQGLDPASIPTLGARDDESYLSAHLYETHDLWHVLTGFAPDVAGELGLQAFYLAQLEGPLPVAILAAGMLNTLGRLDDARARMDAIAHGWALGKAARPFFGLPWAELLGRPLADVRRELGLEAPLAAAA